MNPASASWRSWITSLLQYAFTGPMMHITAVQPVVRCPPNSASRISDERYSRHGGRHAPLINMSNGRSETSGATTTTTLPAHLRLGANDRAMACNCVRWRGQQPDLRGQPALGQTGRRPAPPPGMAAAISAMYFCAPNPRRHVRPSILFAADCTIPAFCLPFHGGKRQTVDVPDFATKQRDAFATTTLLSRVTTTRTVSSEGRG